MSCWFRGVKQLPAYWSSEGIAKKQLEENTRVRGGGFNRITSFIEHLFPGKDKLPRMMGSSVGRNILCELMVQPIKMALNADGTPALQNKNPWAK